MVWALPFSVQLSSGFEHEGSTTVFCDLEAAKPKGKVKSITETLAWILLSRSTDTGNRLPLDSLGEKNNLLLHSVLLNLAAHSNMGGFENYGCLGPPQRF